MVFGAELLPLGLDVFFAVFFVLFFLLVFFVVLLAGALFVVEGAALWLFELAPCACAAYGTVDAPTNASKANAEINAFISVLLRSFEVRAGGHRRTCPDIVRLNGIRVDSNRFRRIGDKFPAAILRSSARVARKSHAQQRHISTLIVNESAHAKHCALFSRPRFGARQ